MQKISILLPLIIGFILAGNGLMAQTLVDAKNSIDADLQASIEAYAQLQADIREEKVPLSKRLNEVEREANDKERELNTMLRMRDASERGLLEINEDIEKIEENIQYMENLLNDFTRRFEASINVAEKQLYQEQIDVVKGFTEVSDTGEEASFTQIFEAQSGVLSSALTRVGDVIGGASFPGSAEVPGGAQKDGSFIILGPVAFFSASDGTSAGLVDRSQPVRPKVIDIGPEFSTEIASVASSGTGALPQDPTQNDALEIALNQPTFEDEIRAGGVWVWPIIGFFTLSILIAIFKVFEIYQVKRPKEVVIQEILTLVNSGKKDEAMQKAQSIPGPFGVMLTDAVSFSGDSRELLEEVLYERMLETQPKLERLLPFIAVTAATAPLLGLLGTVTGMINTFQQITLFGTSDASKLAGGISEALITTKYGLITAIPALIMHALLARRAQGVMASMEKYAAAFVNGLNNGSNE